MKEYILTEEDLSGMQLSLIDSFKELVMCKDCKFLRFTGTVWKCQNRSVMMLCEPNDYCSRGERHDED